MDAAQWKRLSAFLDEVLDQPESARAAYIDQHTAGDAALQKAAHEMLRKMQESGDFLETPPTLVAPETVLEGQRFGAWQIEGLIGRGGMGAVYAVSRQEGGFEQRGALKRLPEGDAEDRWRFEAERQILARLDHPGLARIHDGGVDAGGQPWMVIERIDGGPIDEWCRAQNAGFAERVGKVLEVVDAVAFAHKALVLHRDLKPANVLIDASGRSRVIDFGIAKQMDISQRTENVLPLSAPYAAPELLTGDPVGPPCDVYGAGALLYELLAGRPPIDLDGLPVALGVGRILDTAPPALSRQSSPILAEASASQTEDINAVLQKALRKPPGDRYPTLDALADDLRRVLQGAGVAARAGERGYRLRRQLWQWRWAVAATAAIMLSLAVGLVTTLWQRNEAIAARDAALAEEARGDAVRQSLYLLLSESAEAGGSDATGRDVLRRATARLQQQYISTPTKAAPVLHALGELYFYLGDYEEAISVLGPLVLNGEESGVPPETLASARYDLAQSLVRTGNLEEATSLLAEAQAFWQRDPVKWRMRLIDSRLVEAQILRATDPEAAARLLEQALADHIDLHGTDNRLAGIFQNNLGVSLQSIGDLDGARIAFNKAREAWIATGLTETPDALNTANNLAAIETLQGRPENAAPLFAEALTLRRQLFGPSAATAALMSNYGKVLMQLGRHAEARPLLDEASKMAERFSGAGSMLHVAALSGLSEAELVDTGEGEATAALAVQLAGENPAARAMASIAYARTLAHAGRKEAAVAALAQAERDIPALGPAGARLQQAAGALRAEYGL
ncbi:serine/threonine-protein kinase [Hyphomonas sp. WL0036]|uniref:serine/threonine-protein kinase n=1 Tax=Hyphomonas sediminis TaxID=2866160 RepID=UPI001C81C082|nr:serine/threonine-protein kinase [Hyphomonas sediminis]MBY9067168.1 serine/threonine-protein kinase [Hyphomonas sediminis]